MNLEDQYNSTTTHLTYGSKLCMVKCILKIVLRAIFFFIEYAAIQNKYLAAILPVN
jgi:hypothetical protein